MISTAIVIHTVTDRPPVVEVEPSSDGYATVRLIQGDTRVAFYGLEEQLIELFNGLTDRVVDMQCRRKRETPQLDFDNDPCPHMAVTDGRCDDCSVEVCF